MIPAPFFSEPEVFCDYLDNPQAQVSIRSGSHTTAEVILVGGRISEPGRASTVTVSTRADTGQEAVTTSQFVISGFTWKYSLNPGFHTFEGMLTQASWWDPAFAVGVEVEEDGVEYVFPPHPAVAACPVRVEGRRADRQLPAGPQGDATAGRG